MSSLSSLYIKKETLQTLISVIEKKGEKGVELTVSINDETNQWGQNLTSFVSQSKEQREAKKDRFYVGNGKVFWTDGNIKVADKPEQNNLPPSESIGDDSDLPF